MTRPLHDFLDRFPDLPAHAATVVWTLLLVGFWRLDTANTRTEQIEFARAEARAACRTDAAYTRWVASLGGLYATVSQSNPPIPRLAHLPDRDARTTDGQSLTLINPGCMVEAVRTRTVGDPRLASRIIGTGPGHSDTSPDRWNTTALRALAAGQEESFGFAVENGKSVFRYMTGLRTEAACLRCHADQGFREGDLQGGIRMDLPIDSAGFMASDHEQRDFTLGLVGVWLLGAAGIQGGNALHRSRRRDRQESFRRLAEREERYREVVESSPEGFWLVDNQGRILEVNDVYVERSGYTREEILRLHVNDLEAREDPEATRLRMAEVRQHGHLYFDTIHRTKTGQIWPAEVKATYSPAHGGRFAAFFRDLSRQNRSEALMRIRTRLTSLAQGESVDTILQAALDEAELLTGSSIGFFHFVDPDQENLTLQTWSTHTLGSMCKAEAKGHHYPISQAGVWVDCVREGRPVVHNHYEALPHKHGLPPGHARVEREVVVPVSRENRILAIMGLGNKATDYGQEDVQILESIAGMATDMVLRKKAREELTRFFELVPDLICVADRQGHFRQLNAEWSRLLGIPLESLRTDSFLRSIHPSDRRGTLRTFTRVVRGEPISGFVNRVRAADGSVRWIEWNAIFVPGDQLVFAAARDITERHEARRLADLQAALGAALTSGHDSRDILGRGLEILIEAADMDCGGLYLMNPAAGALELSVYRNFSPGFIAKVCHVPADSLRGRLVLKGDPIYVGHPELLTRYAEAESVERLRALGLVPIRNRDDVIGCVNVASRTTDEIPPLARHRLEILVPQLGSVIARLRAEEALRESERRLRLLFEGATDAFLWVDAGSATIVDSNHAAERLLNREREEIIGQCVTFCHPPEELDRCLTAFRKIGQGAPPEPVETEVVHPDGTRRRVLISASVTEIGGSRLIQGILHDITDRTRAQAELLRQQSLLQAIFEHSPFMLCLVDTEGRIERMNRAMSRLGDALPSRLAERPFIGDVFGCLGAQEPVETRPQSPICKACVLWHTMRESGRTGEGTERFEFTLPVLRNGRQIELRLAASTAIVPVGSESRLLVCLEDITSTKQLERQLLQAQKMEAVGQLAGGVAHDFNNIVGATMMHLHLLLDTPGMDPEMRSALQELEGEARRAANLTRQLLLFSRREVAQIRRVNTNDVVDGLLKMLRRLLGEHIEIEFHPAPAPAWIDADPGMLEQVIMNLAVNARDAMPKGGFLRLSTRHVEVDSETANLSAEARVGAFVCLSVEDSGSGIDPSVLGRIFEPFFTTKAAGKGTGLGLATAYGIVRQHQGWIDVQSRLGHGTTFLVYLPASQEGGDQLVPKGRKELPRGSETVLLVEDDPSLLKTASLLLRACGYRVLEARNGPEALTAWQECAGRVHALFSDMVMPGGLSGMELAQELRRAKPSLKVLICSGYSNDLVQAGGHPGETTTFLPKPYTPAALAEALRQCLDSPG